MAEQSEIQTAATPTNGNTLSLPNNSNSDPTWNYTWDEKLCKTTLKLFTPTVYTPPILPLPDIRDPKRHYVCPVEGCKKTFNRESRSQFRVHLKRHLPDSEKPFKCDEPTCTRAFVRIDELTIHKRTHTGEKPYECEQCGKKFTRNHHLYKHLGTHIKKTKISAETSIEVSSKEVGGDDSDAESDNSSKDLDVPVKQEIDTETDADTDAETDVDDYLHDMEEIKVEPENITEPFIPAFYSYDQRVHINEAKMQEIGNGAGDISNASNNFKSNDTSSSSLAPIKMEVPVKKDIYRDKYDIPIKLEVPVKQEIDTEATPEYDHRFEEYDQCITRNIKNQPGMVAESYCPEFYSSREPPSMTHAIHRLAFPTPITTTDIKSLSNPTNNIESESLQAAINLLDFPIPISANNIKSESNPTNIESEYKPIEKPYKCSVEGCDRAFKVPYGLKRHSWVHTKVKTFECDKCMKKFLRKDHLSKHMKTHSRIPIIKYPKGLAE